MRVLKDNTFWDIFREIARLWSRFSQWRNELKTISGRFPESSDDCQTPVLKNFWNRTAASGRKIRSKKVYFWKVDFLKHVTLSRDISMTWHHHNTKILLLHNFINYLSILKKSRLYLFYFFHGKAPRLASIPHIYIYISIYLSMYISQNLSKNRISRKPSSRCPRNLKFLSELVFTLTRIHTKFHVLTSKGS